jgi:hypothetical protein
MDSMPVVVILGYDVKFCLLFQIYDHCFQDPMFCFT